MEANSTPTYIYRADYAAIDWEILQTDLDVRIHSDHAIISIELKVKAANTQPEPLQLYGEQIELLDVYVDGQVCPSETYTLNGHVLSVSDLPQACTLKVVSRCCPYTNTALEGLYASGDMLCTQCEPEGFRRIAFYPDRPDVMSIFTTRIEADKSFPQLLSNGNLLEKGEVGAHRHYAIWHDPHPKPSYLFALVAGDLECVRDAFVTRSGRKVALHIYVEHGNAHLTQHAMDSLKKSMKWDEDIYGLEYDLDLFQIVAVSHFNMGAMENKGLNIFNSKFVLADQNTATDDDLGRVESIIAHEYFHNWTGNRVTCRDWFQLTLKEGLTVFRDQCFSADLHDAGVKRAEDVKMLRTIQFSEDASPTAHPIRPERYAEINNFYTPTIYEKGAEVIRMMHTVLGAENYRKGIDIYFQRHDGQAVTCDDFIAAMNSASDIDIEKFSIWYSQAGTPHLSVKRRADNQIYFEQSLPQTKAETGTEPMPIPVRMAMINPQGQEASFSIDGGPEATEHVFILDQRSLAMKLSSSKEDISVSTPSILRHFSAPVRLSDDLSLDEIAHLSCYDTDKVNRGEAFQKLFLKVLSDDHGENAKKYLLTAIHQLLSDTEISDEFKAMCLELPSQSESEQIAQPADPIALFQARLSLAQQIGESCDAWFSDFVMDEKNLENASSRALLQKVLYCGVQAGSADVLRAAERFASAQNMTVTMASLRALNMYGGELREKALQRFFDKWSNDSLVLEKWFALQASSPHLDGLEGLEKLLAHDKYDAKNPNKIRSVLGSFVSANTTHFHNETGSGYHFIARQLVELDKQNPQIAARLGIGLTRFAHYQPSRQKLICEALHVLNENDLSKDLGEVVASALSQ